MTPEDLTQELLSRFLEGLRADDPRERRRAYRRAEELVRLALLDAHNDALDAAHRKIQRVQLEVPTGRHGARWLLGGETEIGDAILRLKRAPRVPSG